MDDTPSLDARIGARIRAERELRGWSLTDLAARASVSRAMIHKVERGASSPTAQLLARLAGGLGLAVSTLLARAERAGSRLARLADQTETTDPSSSCQHRQVAPRADQPLNLVQMHLPPGAALPLPGSGAQAHLLWVLAGQLEVQEPAARHLLQPGDCLERGTPSDCTLRNTGVTGCCLALIALRGGQGD